MGGLDMDDSRFLPLTPNGASGGALSRPERTRSNRASLPFIALGGVVIGVPPHPTSLVSDTDATDTDGGSNG